MKTPLFVIGSGRSGTTLMYELLTMHKEFAWASNLTNRCPWFPEAAFLSRVEFLSGYRLFQPASETIEGFRYCGLEEFRLPLELTVDTSDDELQSVAEKTRSYISRHQRVFRRDRYISKNTTNSMKIDLLRHIFPDACFVHIYRHPFAVISSLLNVGFWEDLPLWWADGKTPRQLVRFGEDNHVVAGKHWSNQVEMILRKLEDIPIDDVYSVSYEELVGNPSKTMEEISDRFDLNDLDFLSKVSMRNVSKSSLDKWKGTMDSQCIRSKLECVVPLANRLGYSL